MALYLFPYTFPETTWFGLKCEVEPFFFSSTATFRTLKMNSPSRMEAYIAKLAPIPHWREVAPPKPLEKHKES